MTGWIMVGWLLEAGLAYLGWLALLAALLFGIADGQAAQSPALALRVTLERYMPLFVVGAVIGAAAAPEWWQGSLGTLIWIAIVAAVQAAAAIIGTQVIIETNRYGEGRS